MIYWLFSMGNVVPDTDENANLCFCPGCPTYKISKLTGILYCGKGMAKEKVTPAECICPKCPVWMNYKLDQQYYCLRGRSVDNPR